MDTHISISGTCINNLTHSIYTHLKYELVHIDNLLHNLQSLIKCRILFCQTLKKLAVIIPNSLMLIVLWFVKSHIFSLSNMSKSTPVYAFLCDRSMGMRGRGGGLRVGEVTVKM